MTFDLRRNTVVWVHWSVVLFGRRNRTHNQQLLLQLLNHQNLEDLQNPQKLQDLESHQNLENLKNLKNLKNLENLQNLENLESLSCDQNHVRRTTQPQRAATASLFIV